MLCRINKLNFSYTVHIAKQIHINSAWFTGFVRETVIARADFSGATKLVSDSQIEWCIKPPNPTPV